MMRLLDTSICIPLVNGADAQMAQRLLAGSEVRSAPSSRSSELRE